MKEPTYLIRLVNFKFEYFSQSILDYLFRRYLSTYYYKLNVCQTNLELYTRWNVSIFKIVHSVKTRKYNFSATTFLKLLETNSTIIQTKLKSTTLLSWFHNGSLSSLTGNREYVLEIEIRTLLTIKDTITQYTKYLFIYLAQIMNVNQ